MPNYRESAGSATRWRRARQVLIDNPRDAVPSISFQEEDCVAVGGAEYRTHVMGEPVVRGEFEEAATFPLVDPETGASLGTMTHAQLYIALHSLYLYLAQQRDEAVAQQQA